MLRYFLLAYIVLYIFFSIGLFAMYASVVSRDEKKSDHWWETPLDIALLLTGLIGMMLLYLHIHTLWLTMLWRPVSIILVVVQFWGNFRARSSWGRSAQGVTERGAVAFAVQEPVSSVRAALASKTSRVRLSSGSTTGETRRPPRKEFLLFVHCVRRVAAF